MTIMLPVIRASAVHRLQRGFAAEYASCFFESTMFETPLRAREQRPKIGPPHLIRAVRQRVHSGDAISLRQIR
jgi:hypothetical protein